MQTRTRRPGWRGTTIGPSPRANSATARGAAAAHALEARAVAHEREAAARIASITLVPLHPRPANLLTEGRLRLQLGSSPAVGGRGDRREADRDRGGPIFDFDPALRHLAEPQMARARERGGELERAWGHDALGDDLFVAILDLLVTGRAGLEILGQHVGQVGAAEVRDR